MPWKSHDCDLTMRLLKDPYPPNRGINLHSRQAFVSDVQLPTLPVGQSQEGRAHTWCHWEFTFFMPASCHGWWPFSSVLFLERGKKKKKQFHHIDICSALKQLPQLAVQELSCDKGNVPRDTSGEKSGWQKHRRSACYRWGAEAKLAHRPLAACAAGSSIPSALRSGLGGFPWDLLHFVCPHYQVRLYAEGPVMSKRILSGLN